MSKKYKHIKLPNQLFSSESSHTFTAPPFPQTLPELDKQIHKNNLSQQINSLSITSSKNSESKKLPQDKSSTDIEVKFRGVPDKKFVNKYNIDVYQKEKDLIIGKIKNTTLPGQRVSDFQRLEQDVSTYVQTDQNKSYFENIEEISPLSIEDILDDELKEQFDENPDEKMMIDISLADNTHSSAEKISALRDEYRESFITSINTEFVHFCRVKANYNDIEKTTNEYNGIVFVEKSPVYDLAPSQISHQLINLPVQRVDREFNPIFVFDTDVNANHTVLQEAVFEQIGRHSTGDVHGTGVASLVVCGLTLFPGKQAIQHNPIITVNIEDGSTIENLILETVQKYSSAYPMLIANLSLNDYGKIYLRKRVSPFTKLLDELSHKYNCLFCVSAGNIKELFSNQKVINYCVSKGYPNYFTESFCNILPPADSINNVSIGSIAYQQSPRSISRIKNPVPFTRANIADNGFVKPDFVQYDSNLILDGDKYTIEENGPFMAGVNDQEFVQSAGTSFSTPIVTHDAGVIHNQYPSYTANTIKALLTHFSDEIEAEQITDEGMKRRLIGFGMPNLEKALYSLSNSATLIVEDEIGIDKAKKIKIPIPESIAGDHRKRLRINMTLAYNPLINPKDVDRYNPIVMYAHLIRPDNRIVTSGSTRDKMSDAYLKSNIKKYPPLEVSTKANTGDMWEIELVSESRADDVPRDYKQKYSLVITVEDMKNDESIDLHSDIVQMIEVETHIDIPIQIVS